MSSQKKFLFLRKLQQVDFLIDKRADLLKTSHLISVDLDVSAKLSELGLSYEEAWRPFTTEELNKKTLDAIELMNSWYKPWEEKSKFYDVSLIKADRGAFVFLFEEAIFAKMLYQNFMSKENNAELIVIENFREPKYNDVFGDVFDSIFTYLAEKEEKKVYYYLIPERNSILKGISLYPLFKQIADATYQYLMNKWHWFKTETVAEDKILMCLISGEYVRHGSLAMKLKKHYKNRFFTITQETFKFRKYSDKENIFFLSFKGSIFKSIFSYFSLKKKLKKLWEEWLTERGNYKGDYPEIFSNPHLDFQFEYFFLKRWVYLTLYISQAYETLKQLKPKCLIISNLTYLTNSALAELASSLKIKTFSLPHSMLVAKVLSNEGDILTTWYKNQIKIFDNFGEEKEIVLTGCPYENFEGHPSPKQLEENLSLHEELKIDPSKKVITILTVNGGGIYLHSGNHQKSYESIFQYLEKYKDKLHIIIKCHPNEDFDYQLFYQSFIDKYHLNDNVTILKRFSTEKLASVSDIGIIVNYVTSTYHPFISFKKPIIFIDTVELHERYRVDFLYDLFVVVKNIKDIWSKLDKLLFNESQYKEIADFQNLFYSNLSNETTAEKSLENIMTLADRIIGESTQNSV